MKQPDRRVEYMPLSKVKVAKRNPKDHDLGAISQSMGRFGYVEPVVIDERTGQLVAGHGRVETLRELKTKGQETPKGIQVGADGEWLMPVLRGWASKDDAEAESYIIASNRLVELGGWDEEGLAAMLKDLAGADALLGTGYGVPDLDKLLAEVAGGASSEIVVDEDDVPAMPSDVWVKQGDLFQLGHHRILCGSCRTDADVDRLLNGERITVAVTSPPYAAQRDYDTSSGFEPILPEKYTEWFEAVQRNIAKHLAEDGSFFLNIKEHCEDGQRHMYVKDLTLAHVRTWGWRLVDEFVWVHGGTPKAVQKRFKNGWEPIFQFTKGPHKFRPDSVRHRTDDIPDWDGAHPSMQGGVAAQPGGAVYEADRKNRPRKQKASNAALQGSSEGGKAIHDSVANAMEIANGWAYPSNVLSVGKNREALGHGAAYPVGLPEFFIKAFSDSGDLVFDPFMGSGTTLIAAEKTRRKCVGTELSPAYTQIILARWEKMTGQKAERIGAAVTPPVKRPAKT